MSDMEKQEPHFDYPEIAAHSIYQVLIGKISKSYYLARFSDFEARGRFKPTWNWSAFAFGFWWLIFRNMYAYAFGFVAIVLILVIMSGSDPLVYIYFPQAMLLNVFSSENENLSRDLVYVFMGHIVFPVSANYLYYLNARRKTSQLLTVYSKLGTIDFELRKAESSKPAISTFVAKVFLTWVLFTVVTTLFSPIFASNVARRMKKESVPLIHALTLYKEKNGHYPETLDQLKPAYIKDLPKCKTDDKRPIIYSQLENGTYFLTCYTFLFLKHSYDSETNKWRTWD